ncbi:MAG: STAS domain-containing protein [Butyrivibrio sp.]|nr:STAS domain-containing protein [Butyrivibrio sp.]
MENELIYRAPARVDGKNAEEVLKELTGLVQQEPEAISVDMTETTYLSSAGLRSLTAGYKMMRARGGNFRLINVSDRIRDLLDVTGLSGYFPIE